MLVQPKGFSGKYQYDTADVISVTGKLSPISNTPFIELTLDNESIGIFTIALFPTGNNVNVVAQKLSRAFGLNVKAPTGTDRKKLTKELVSQISGIELPVSAQVFQDPESTEIDLPWGEPKVKTTQKQKQGTKVSCEW